MKLDEKIKNIQKIIKKKQLDALDAVIFISDYFKNNVDSLPQKEVYLEISTLLNKILTSINQGKLLKSEALINEIKKIKINPNINIDLNQLKIISKLLENYLEKDKNVEIDLSSIKWPSKPSEAIPVVLTDKFKKEFYDSLRSLPVFSGGGSSVDLTDVNQNLREIINLIENNELKLFVKNDGTSDKALIDDDKHLQVDILTMPDVSLEVKDIEIGAVEIKDSLTDTRAIVGADGLQVEVKKSVLPMGSATEDKQDDIITAVGNIQSDALTDAELRATPISVTESSPLDISALASEATLTKGLGLSSTGTDTTLTLTNATTAYTCPASSVPASAYTLVIYNSSDTDVYCRFTTGTLLTDDYFLTITTGAARKGIVLDDGTRLTSGKIPIATTNGRLIDSQTPLAGTKVYYVSDSSGGAVDRKLTFIDGILTSET